MKTLSLRVWIPVIVFLLASLLIIGMFFYQTTVQTANLKKNELSHVEHLMIRLQRLTEESLSHQHFQAIEHEISALGIETEVKALALINPAGLVDFTCHYAWKKNKAIDVIPQINANHLNNAVKQQKVVIEFSESTQSINAYFPVLFSSKKGELRSFSYGLLYLNYDLNYKLNSIFYEVLIESGVLWLSYLLLMFLLTVILTYLVNRPVNHLANIMQSFSGDELIKSQLTGNGELAILGDSFNQLSTRLISTQQHLNKQMDLYEILSATNQLIIRTNTYEDLFDGICQISVIKTAFYFHG